MSDFKRMFHGFTSVGASALAYSLMPVYAPQVAIGLAGYGLLQVGISVIGSDSKEAKKMNSLFEMVGYKNKEGQCAKVKKVVKTKIHDTYFIKIPFGMDGRSLGKIIYSIQNAYQNDADIIYKDHNYRVKVYKQKLLDGKQYPFTPININDKKHLQIVIGKTLDGELILDLTKTTPHTLLASATNMGKSSLLKAICINIMENYSPSKVKIAYLDNKEGTEANIFSDCKHFNFIGQCVEDMDLYLKQLQKIIKIRMNQLKEQKVVSIVGYNAKVQPKDRWHWQFVIVDELFPLFTKDSKFRAEVYNNLGSVMAICRAVGIHFIIASQRTTTDVLDPRITVNCGAKIGLSVSKQQDSLNIIEMGGLEDIPSDAKCRGICVVDEPTRFQGFWIDDQTVDFYCEKHKRLPNDIIPPSPEDIRKKIKLEQEKIEQEKEEQLQKENIAKATKKQKHITTETQGKDSETTTLAKGKHHDRNKRKKVNKKKQVKELKDKLSELENLNDSPQIKFEGVDRK